MAKQEIHVADIGTVVEITVKEDSTIVDLSGATTKQIVFMKPTGSTLTKTASFVTDGTDGKIKYATIAGDLDVHGDWKVQAILVFPSGTWHSSAHDFQVHENLS